MEIEKSKTCAVTGHRIMLNDIDEKRVEDVFSALISNGVSTFLNGMALGFDTMCFHVLERLREEHNVKIIACIPCESQAERFSEKNKREYERMVESADERIYLSREYTPSCMMKRNVFMVDNCCVLVAYKRRSGGGTAKTVEYAEKQGKETILL